MPEKLTQAAQDAINEAVRIVREDKWDKFLRERVTKHSEGSPKNDPPNDPPVDPPTKNDPPNDPPSNEDTKTKSAYWGVFED